MRSCDVPPLEDLPDKSPADETAHGAQANPGQSELERFWETVRRIPRYVLLMTNLMRDPRVPLSAKAKLSLGGAYTISPIDLVPGVIPVAGQLDDLLVLLLTLRHVVRSTDARLIAEHLERAGVRHEDLDHDLRVTKDTAVWLASRGVRAAGRVTVKSLGRLRSFWESRR
ncbi:MAG: hypothetical protein KatS3mg059_1401 [Thermomicrobiales bacterium]|nr:MAG: hypothetical protein KatS3mg059_1401 [Thermomicrobiales bacterium]